MDDFTQTLQQGLDDVSKYADELRAEAQGDYDFVTKFLDQQHKIALGTDDQARAAFIEKVANAVEAKVGRIPFDFQLKTDREKQDLSDFLKKQEIERNDIEDQQRIFEAQQRLAVEKEKRGISEQANTRGMLGSGIENRQQSQAAEERKINIQDPANRQFALSRLLNQFATERGQLESARNLEDIKTGARRDAQDTQYQYNYQTEQAKRNLEKQLADIRRQQQTEELATRSLLQTQELQKLYNTPYVS